MFVTQIHNQLQTQFSNLSDDFVRLQMELDEQNEANGKLQAQLQKAGADAQQLKTKYEKDITIISDELEDTKSVSRRSQWSSGSMPDCSARGPEIESHCGQLCLLQRRL